MFGVEKDFYCKILSVFCLSWEGKQNYAKARPFNALSMRLSGGADFSHADNVYHAAEKSIIFVPADYDYIIKPNKNEKVIAVHFDIIKRNYNEINVFNPSNPSIFISLFKNMYNTWSNKPVGYGHKLYSIFYSILENIEIQNKDIALSSEANLQNVINYINSNFSDSSLSVEDLARFCNLSTTYFRKIFYQNLSVTPLQYLTNLRIEHATALLKSGYYSVEETAYRSGYNDVKYFSTAYKKLCGVSPSKIINK